MNCPRCKHGTVPLEGAFCCENCHAGFLAKGEPVADDPLVREEPALGRFEVRLSAGPDKKTYGGVILFFIVGALYLMSPERAELRLLLPLSAAVFLWSLFQLLRNFYVRVLVQATDDALFVSGRSLFSRSPRRLDRDVIDGLWIECAFDDDGPTGEYALMMDTGGQRSVQLLGPVASLPPLVVLSEKLAARLRVTSDTRSSEFD